MVYVQNSGGGASNGTSVTLGNSDDNGAGNKLDVKSGNVTYTNTWYGSAGTGFKCQGGSGSPALVGWDSTVALSDVVSAPAKSSRQGLVIPGPPAATCNIIQVRTASGQAGNVQLRTDRKLNVVDAGGTIRYTTTTALTVDTKYRVEWRVKKGTSSSDGTIEFALYAHGSGTPIETYGPVTNVNQGTSDFIGFRRGELTGVATPFAIYFFDISEDDSEALLGLAVGPSAPSFTVDVIYDVDGTDSVGDCELTQTSGSTSIIYGPFPGPTWRIKPPANHHDKLHFQLEADGDGPPVTETFIIYPRALSNTLVFDGADWV